MRGSYSSAARPWTGHATSGGTSSRHARSASSRPKRTGNSLASTPFRVTTRSSSPCRSDGGRSSGARNQESATCSPDQLPPDLPTSQRPQVRELLLHPPDLLPRVLLQAAEALAQIEQRVLVAALGAAQFLPRHRRRYRRTLAGACGIGRDRGLLQRISQIVDEDFSLAQRFRDLGHVALGIVGGHGERHRLREVFGGGPVCAVDGQDDVQALGAGKLDEALQIDGGEPLAHLPPRPNALPPAPPPPRSH